jgi:hypothetical protein
MCPVSGPRLQDGPVFALDGGGFPACGGGDRWGEVAMAGSSAETTVSR